MRQAWTPEEDAALKELHGTMSNRAISEQLGRTVCAVKNRANRLGLNQSSEYITKLEERAPQLRHKIKARYTRIADMALERFMKRHGTLPVEAGDDAMDYWIECLQKARKQVFL